MIGSIGDGMMRMRVTDPGDREIGAVPYNASAHRFLRQREQGGMIIGEVSADGQTWTQLGSVASPFDPRFTQVALVGGTYGSEPSPGIVEFEGINIGAVPSAGYCPIDAVHGTFVDGVLAPEWYRRFGPAGCTDSNGDLTLGLSGSTITSCELASRGIFDLTGRSITGDVPATTSDPATTTSFGVAQDLKNNATIANVGGVMVFQVYLGGVLVHATDPMMRPPYSAVEHRRWRLRHDVAANALVAELADASGTYVELDRLTGTFPTNGVYITNLNP